MEFTRNVELDGRQNLLSVISLISVSLFFFNHVLVLLPVFESHFLLMIYVHSVIDE